MVGSLTLDVQQLTVATQPDQLLVAYTAPADSPSQEALRFLLQWSAQTADREDAHATAPGRARTADREDRAPERKGRR